MSKDIYCPRCKYQGKAKRAMKGSFVIELVLWCFFIIPGVIYSLWRLTTKSKVCPDCGEDKLIPHDVYKMRVETPRE